jgi:hypothetical protein
MIANVLGPTLGFAILAALLPLQVLALLSAIPAARQPATIKTATIWEAITRALISIYFLWAVFL